jgi:hypothetical protein
MYGCCFSGNVAAVAAHSNSCSYAQQQQQLLQDMRAGASTAVAAAVAAAAAGPSDCWELPEDSVPDAAAAFGVYTAAMTERQVRQLLLNTLPQSALPPRLEQQQLSVLSDDAAASLKQLSTITPPKVFAAPAAAAGGGGAAPVQGSTQTDTHTGSSSSSTKRNMQSAVELLALGAPGCLSGFGLQPDPLLECAWRVMLNSAVIEVGEGCVCVCVC